MPLSLIEGGLLQQPAAALPARRPAPEPHAALERSIDSLYELADHLQRDMEGQAELAGAIRLEHERSHEVGWAVCPVRTCVLASALLPH
jgi:hypothetical protein